AHLVARLHHVARNVDRLAVHLHVTVTHELTRSLAARREAETVDDVVEAQLEADQQVLTRDARLARRTRVQVAEVLLPHTVDALDLLLLTELQRILRRLATPGLRHAVLARRIVPPLHRALLRVTLGSLQEQLLPLAAA